MYVLFIYICMYVHIIIETCYLKSKIFEDSRLEIVVTESDIVEIDMPIHNMQLGTEKRMGQKEKERERLRD